MFGAASSYRSGNLELERKWIESLPVFDGENLREIGLEFICSFPLLKLAEEQLKAQNTTYRVRMLEGYGGYKVEIFIQDTPS